ncbi:hypothetical protein [Mycolicibacterium phlei]|nr:hypothetical protein [Mycolicibacterium phlei]
MSQKSDRNRRRPYTRAELRRELTARELAAERYTVRRTVTPAY